MPSGPDDKLLTGYLLGELSEAQQNRVEEQLFSDHTCFERLEALKAEMTDRYVRETLTPKQKAVFERRFLTAEAGREEVVFARALDGVLREGVEQRKPAFHQQPDVSWWQSVAIFFRSASGRQTAMAAAIIVLAIGAGWLIFERQRLVRRMETAISERDTAQSEAQRRARLEQEISRVNSQSRELDQELQQARKDLEQARQDLEAISRQPGANPVVGTILSLILAPGVRRGNERVENLVVVPQARMVQLQLLIEPGETGTGYRAEIRTKKDELVYRQDRLRSRQITGGKAMLVSIPSNRLTDGVYEVSLYGTTPSGQSEIINYYEFSVTRR